MNRFSFLTALTLTLVCTSPLRAVPGSGKDTPAAGHEILRDIAGSRDAGADLVVSPAPQGPSTGIGLVANGTTPTAQATAEQMLDHLHERGVDIPEEQKAGFVNAMLAAHAAGRGDERFVIASAALDGELTPQQVKQTLAGFDTQFQLHQQLLQSHGREIGTSQTGINHLRAGELLTREEAGRLAGRLNEMDRRITNLFETNTVLGRMAALLAEVLKPERVNKLTENIVGFTPWAIGFLPHTLVALFGTHVATRAPIGPLRKAVRPVQALLWLTFVLTALQASKVGTDRAQKWAQRELAPHLQRVMGADTKVSQIEARRIATAASVSAGLIAAWVLYRRGLLKPPFLTRKRTRKK